MDDNLKYSDEDILALLRSDDVQAITILYDLYFDKMVRVAFKVVGENEAAKDIAQEMFLNIWIKRYQLTIKDPIAPYLARSVVNRCLNYLRDNRKSQHISLQVISDTVKNSGQESLESQDMEQLAKLAIDSLPPKCRLVFNLSRSEEMSHNEISSHLGISKKAVEKQLTKALKHLRHHLKSYLGTLLFF